MFVEYAWDMAWCDPCAADPLTNKQLVELGARWIASDDDARFRPVPGMQGSNAYVTRLHVRYDAQSFPEDLALIETKDRTNFQGRYVLQPSVDRLDELRARRGVSQVAAGALPEGSGEPRRPHRLVALRHQGEDGRKRAADADTEAQVVPNECTVTISRLPFALISNRCTREKPSFRKVL